MGTIIPFKKLRIENKSRAVADIYLLITLCAVMFLLRITIHMIAVWKG